MKKIYSRIKKDKLLHIIFSPSKKNERVNVSQENHFLQFCYLNLNKDSKFLPHKHFWKPNKQKKRIVQESWLVIKGSIKVTLYDLNDKVLTTKILKPGDLSITFEGGHKIDVLKHKTGPYEGKKKDLLYINN